MRQLIYTSVSLVGTQQQALDDILVQARAANGLVDLSGLLWTDGKRFAQVLEGDAETVEETMIRIRQDPRHASIETAADVEVEAREFGHWAMVQPPNDRRGHTLDHHLLDVLRLRGS